MSWILLQLQTLLRSIDPKGLASGLQHSSKADSEILEQGLLFQSLNGLGCGSLGDQGSGFRILSPKLYTS